MLRRCGLVGLTALVAGLSGCAGSALRPDGSPIFGPRAWSEAPAPPQKLVAARAMAPTSAPVDAAAKPTGLARYFPGLHRDAPEPARVVAKARPTWFGLRPSQAVVGTQMYMTDARAGLDRAGPEPVALPVALQVPTDRASSDRSVTPAAAEAVRTDAAPSDRSAGAGEAPSVAPSAPAVDVPDFGGKPSRPGEDEVNPLPPAAEPTPPAAATSRMPELPAIDPRETPRQPDPKSATDADSPADAAPGPDREAVKAATPAPDPYRPTDLPEPTRPASYSTQPATQATPPPAPSALQPTSRVMASPQSQGKPVVAKKGWKHTCFLKKLVRKVGKAGEPTAPTPTASAQR